MNDWFQGRTKEQLSHTVQPPALNMPDEPMVSPSVNRETPAALSEPPQTTTSSQEAPMRHPEQIPPETLPDSHTTSEQPVQNTRPRRERRQRKVYDAHSGTWMSP